MSNYESDEFTKYESDGQDSDSGIVTKRIKGDPVLGDGGRTDDVFMDPTTDQKEMGTDDRTGVKRGRKSAKKHPQRNGPIDSRSRTFVGTLNHPTAEDYTYYRTLPLERISWIIVGDEVGLLGTPHLQMACRFNQQTSMSQARKLFGQNRAHVEIMKGTPEQSAVYCSKQKLFLERGPRPIEKGKEAKAKLDGMVSMIKEGKSDREIFEANPAMYLRYRSSLGAAKSLYAGLVKRAPLEVYWLWGETGAGKSYRAESEAADDGRRLYRQNGSQWWDGYDGDELVIIDDLEETTPFRNLLKITDVYNHLVGTKGSHQYLRAQRMWITASFPPSKIDQGGQLERRMTKIVNMSKSERPDIMAMLKNQFKNNGPTDIMD